MEQMVRSEGPRTDMWGFPSKPSSITYQLRDLGQIRQTVFALISSLLFKNFFKHVFIIERQSMSMGGAKEEGDTEFEAGSRLRAVSTEPDGGLELTNREIMT